MNDNNFLLDLIETGEIDTQIKKIARQDDMDRVYNYSTLINAYTHRVDKSLGTYKHDEVEDWLIVHDLNNEMLTEEQFRSYVNLGKTNKGFDIRKVAEELCEDESIIDVIEYLLMVAIKKYIDRNEKGLIIELLNRVDYLENNNKQRDPILLYYDTVISEYEMKNDNGYSLQDIYVTAYDKNHNSILGHIDHWFASGNKKNYGIMLIHGEPGHGKTSLCRNAIYEFKKGKKYFNARKPSNIFWFTLNSAKWNYEKMDIAYALCKDSKRYSTDLNQMTVQLKQCKNSIVFLDAYDEFYSKMISETNWKSFMDLYRYLNTIARENHIHFIITSRTNAIIKELRSIQIERIPTYALEYLTPSDQDVLAGKMDCIDHLEKLRKDNLIQYFNDQKNKIDLLGIPVIFRLVMQKKYLPNSTKGYINQIELYEKLFEDTSERNISYINSEKENIKSQLIHLAYKIFMNDDQQAKIDTTINNELVYAYYIDYRYHECEIGFKHRSFYQHYLAYYFYNMIANCDTEENAKQFLGSLLPRYLDQEEIRLIYDIYELENPDGFNKRLLKNYFTIFDVLSKTLGIIYNEEMNQPTYDNFKHLVVNTINIFTLAMHIKKEQKVTLGNCTQKIIDIVRIFDSENYYFNNLYFERIDFSRLNLRGDSFNNSNCFFCNFSESDLRYASFKNTNLIGSRMKRCNLGHINLNDATIDFVDFRDTYINSNNIKSQSVKTINYSIKQFNLYNLGVKMGKYHDEEIIGRPLDFKNKQLLLITENIIDNKKYNDSFRKTSWNECSLNSFLNTHNNITNQVINGPLAKDVSVEKVFLLSLDEVMKYFINSDDCKAKPTEYAKKVNGSRLRIDKFTGNAMWWLRSTGIRSSFASFVDFEGTLREDGEIVDKPHIGVRPTFTLIFNSLSKVKQ